MMQTLYIIRNWLIINMQHQNPFGVGMDKNGIYWRTRRKATGNGWRVVENRVTTGKVAIKYVVETKSIR